MNEMYGTEVTVGQMLSVYMDQRQDLRKTMKVINIPTLPQIRNLFSFGTLFVHKPA